jgi:acyl carrier protein
MESENAALDAGLRQRVIDNFGRLASRVLRSELGEVTPDTKLRDKLGMTSTNTLELMLALESLLGIEVDVEDMDEDNTESVGALADFVVAHAQPAG